VSIAHCGHTGDALSGRAADHEHLDAARGAPPHHDDRHGSRDDDGAAQRHLGGCRPSVQFHHQSRFLHLAGDVDLRDASRTSTG